jgi:hypothetical protein
MKCYQCDAAIRSGQRFCEACGAQVDRTCPACHAPAPPDARFCGKCGASFAGKTDVPSGSSPSSDGERRQLTVLFADVVGSTELAAHLDPEALREVLRAYQGICVDSVARYGGNVNQYIGDGVVAFFGYPVAHDNDAERAVLAGLAIVASVRTGRGRH